MISEAGLELIVEDIIQNHHLKSLDVLIIQEYQLGVWQGSIRKNSLEIDGSKCIAAILMHNRSLT